MVHKSPHAKEWSALFARYRGQWVTLADDEVTVVAAAPTAQAALAASTAKGESDPILYRVPESLDTFVGQLRVAIVGSGEPISMIPSRRSNFRAIRDRSAPSRT